MASLNPNLDPQQQGIAQNLANQSIAQSLSPQSVGKQQITNTMENYNSPSVVSQSTATPMTMSQMQSGLPTQPTSGALQNGVTYASGTGSGTSPSKIAQASAVTAAQAAAANGISQPSGGVIPPITSVSPIQAAANSAPSLNTVSNFTPNMSTAQMIAQQASAQGGTSNLSTAQSSQDTSLVAEASQIASASQQITQASADSANVTASANAQNRAQMISQQINSNQNGVAQQSGFMSSAQQTPQGFMLSSDGSQSNSITDSIPSQSSTSVAPISYSPVTQPIPQMQMGMQPQMGSGQQIQGLQPTGQIGQAGQQAQQAGQPVQAQTSGAVPQQALNQMGSAVSQSPMDQFNDTLKSMGFSTYDPNSYSPLESSMKQAADAIAALKVSTADNQYNNTVNFVNKYIPIYQQTYQNQLNTLAGQKAINMDQINTDFSSQIANNQIQSEQITADKNNIMGQLADKNSRIEGFTMASLNAMGIDPTSTYGIQFIAKQSNLAALNFADTAMKFNAPLMQLANDTNTLIATHGTQLMQVQNDYNSQVNTLTSNLNDQMMKMDQTVYSSEQKREDDKVQAISDQYNAMTAIESEKQQKMMDYQKQAIQLHENYLDRSATQYSEYIKNTGQMAMFNAATGQITPIQDQNGNPIMTLPGEQAMTSIAVQNQQLKQMNDATTIAYQHNGQTGLRTSDGSVIPGTENFVLPAEVKGSVWTPNGQVLYDQYGKQVGSFSFGGTGTTSPQASTIPAELRTGTNVSINGTQVVAPVGAKGGQCGEFVDDILKTAGINQNTPDSWDGKKGLVDSSITTPVPGVQFFMPVANADGSLTADGHMGIVKSYNPSTQTVNVIDSNWSNNNDEQIRERDVPLSQIMLDGGGFAHGIDQATTQQQTPQLSTQAQNMLAQLQQPNTNPSDIKSAFGIPNVLSRYATPDVRQKYDDWNSAINAFSQGGSIGQDKIQAAASKTAATQQTVYLDTTTRAYNTATDNLNVLTNFMQKYNLNDSNTPIVNQLTNAVKSGIAAPGEVAAFQTTLAGLRSEYAQVLARGGEVTDSIRNEANTLVPDNLSPSEMQMVTNQLKAEGENVLKEASSSTQQAITGQQQNTQQQPSPPSISPQEGQTIPFTYTDPTTGQTSQRFASQDQMNDPNFQALVNQGVVSLQQPQQ